MMCVESRKDITTRPRKAWINSLRIVLVHMGERVIYSRKLCVSTCQERLTQRNTNNIFYKFIKSIDNGDQEVHVVCT